MARQRKPRRGRRTTWQTVRELAGALPDAEESTSYGTPAFKLRGKLFVRLKEDRETIVVRIELPDRDMRIAADPEVFFMTDHYLGSPFVLVRLSAIAKRDLAEILADACRLAAR